MSRMANRIHPAGHMDGLRELAAVTEPVAVVVRPDGSLDVYGCIGVVDQRPDVAPEISGLLHTIRADIEQSDGSWSGADLTELMCTWFTSMGLDINAPVVRATR